MKEVLAAAMDDSKECVNPRAKRSDVSMGASEESDCSVSDVGRLQC